MEIVIHRGARQIGGCCTEIRTQRGRVLIDFGDELPEPGQVPRPLAVDHSAYEAYMFLIEAQGKTVLHTGDYRLHGFKGKGVLTALEKYVGQVDVLITEGTTLSRPGQPVVTERDVEQQAAALMGENKCVFLLCSATNIDRLAAFCAAAKQAGRLDPELRDFVESQAWTRLHASGHGSPQQIKVVCGGVQPPPGRNRKG